MSTISIISSVKYTTSETALSTSGYVLNIITPYNKLPYFIIRYNSTNVMDSRVYKTNATANVCMYDYDNDIAYFGNFTQSHVDNMKFDTLYGPTRMFKMTSAATSKLSSWTITQRSKDVYMSGTTQTYRCDYSFIFTHFRGISPHVYNEGEFNEEITADQYFESVDGGYCLDHWVWNASTNDRQYFIEIVREHSSIVPKMIRIKDTGNVDGAGSTPVIWQVSIQNGIIKLAKEV